MRNLFISCFLFFCYSASGAQNDYLFSHIRTGRESSNLEINCIFRDSDGFVWFGTSKGLLCYNGMEITSASPVSGSPLGDFIASIQEDALGRLWVLVNDERYVLYDRFTKRCIEDSASELDALAGRDTPPRLLYIDADKNLWIADAEQVSCCFTQRGECGAVITGSDPATLEDIVRRGDDCYLLYASGAVEVVDARTLCVKKKLSAPLMQSGKSVFNRIFVDSHNDVWITDHRTGVWRYPAVDGRWIGFGEAGEVRISTNSVRDVTEDDKGHIWIATDHGGINIFDCRTGRVEVLMHDPFDRTTITSNSVYSLYRDAEDNIWVGYYKRGVSLYCEARQNFFTRHIRGLLNRNLQDDISAICEDAAGNLWFGTDEFGVVRQEQTTGAETFFRAGQGAQSLGSDVVVCLYCDSRGRVWIGTYQGGLSCYENGRMRRYVFREDDPYSLADNSVWAIDEDCDGNIWIGTLSGGVQRFDSVTGHFETFSVARNNLSADYILDISCRRGEQLYVSTVNGIERIDVRKGACEMLIEGGEAKFMNICRDSRGLLWIVGKRGEVKVFDTKDGRMLHVPRELEKKGVKSVIEDDNKNMWLATDNGLYNIIVRADPRAGEYDFTTYRFKRQEDDRLQDWSYNVRSVARTRRGEIVFGGVNGYYVIDPVSPGLDAISADKTHVTFTALRINNAEIQVDSTYDGSVILRRGTEFTDRIDLRYRQNRFSLEFSPLDYSSPFCTEYFYRLDGFSDEWLPVNSERNAVTFTNLSPGEYRMRIRALNTDGTLGEDAAMLELVVHPPFWRTTAAFMVYLALALFAVWAVLTSIFRRQQRRLELQRAEMETERQNQLNEMKIRFFTNISHDFRTPLSLIITPVEEMRNRCGDELRSSLEIVHRNALRLLQLVNQLLDFRKLDVYGTTLNLSHGDFVAFVREICSSFELLSEDSHITLSVESSVERLDMDFDKDKLSKVFMNLLSNAFKYTPGEGRVSVSIGTTAGEDDREMVVVAVRDTGVGIPDADKPHIFDRFYQVDRDYVRNGSGIGLHIVREFIALHGGSIAVRDNAPRGSVFHFVLPLVTHEKPAEEVLDNIEQLQSVSQAEGRPVILLVEDNEEFRRFMRECLVHDNDIHEAADGVEALELLRKTAVDMIISDVMMPRMDGLELCRAVKQDIATSHIPIILLTARAMQEHEREGLAEGADDYITKPFNLSILKLRIAKLLEWHRRSHELFRKTAEIKPSEITITSLDEKLIENAVRIVEENIDNSEFSVEDLSAKLGMHRTNLYKKLTFITGKSPLEFIRVVRLKRAVQLLEKSRMNISEIAYMVGFNSPKIFTKYFREAFNMSPRDYLRSISSSDHHVL